MTTRWMIATTLAASMAAAVPILAQSPAPRLQVRPAPGPQFGRRGVPSCTGDTPGQLESRGLALDAVRQINTAAQRYKQLHDNRYPTWKELGDSPPITRRGGLSLKWGEAEPVPDWKIHYVSDPDAYVFTLTGVEDKCGVTFLSDDSGRILDGRDISPRYGVVPLSTR